MRGYAEVLRHYWEILGIRRRLGRALLAERLAADEERERLVLVRRPAGRADEEECAEAGCDRPDTQAVGLRAHPFEHASRRAFRWHSVRASARDRRAPC